MSKTTISLLISRLESNIELLEKVKGNEESLPVRFKISKAIDDSKKAVNYARLANNERNELLFKLLKENV